MTEERRQTATVVLAFLLFFVVFMSGLRPFDFEFNNIGDIEGGWITASTYAGLHRFAYGTQIVFTNGPLFPLYHREVAGELTGWYVAARLAVVLFLAYGFARLSANARLSGIIVAAIAAIILWPTISRQANDAMLLLLPLLTVLLLLANRAGWPTLIVGVFLAAAAALGKVSFIPFCIGAFALADIALLSRRRPPLTLALYALASFGLFVLAGQQPANFVPFLVGSAEMAAAYSAGLAMDKSVTEILIWLGIAALTLLVIVVRDVGAVRAGRTRAIDAVLRLLLIVGFFYIAIKASFVRHDSHTIAGWGMVIFVMILHGLPGTMPNWRPRVTAILYVLPAIATLVLGALTATRMISSITGAPATRSFFEELTADSGIALAGQVSQVALLVRDPGGWVPAQIARSAEYDALVRREQPLPPIVGRVDALSNVQQSILAAGLDYWPRPTIQENMTVSPSLIERNRVFLESPDAPPTLIFAPGATDRRHPATVEGSLWPLLIADYAVSARERDQLILTRRAAPIDVTRAEVSTSTIGFAEELPLPQTGQPLFLYLDIDETTIGKLVVQAFKPPLVFLFVTYPDGTTERYRLIPGMISEGMLISPTVYTSDDYARLASGGDLSGLRFPASIRVETRGPWAYDPTITARIETLSIPPN